MNIGKGMGEKMDQMRGLGKDWNRRTEDRSEEGRKRWKGREESIV